MITKHSVIVSVSVFYFFFNDTATTEIDPYTRTLSLPDPLPIFARQADRARPQPLHREGEIRQPRIIGEDLADDAHRPDIKFVENTAIGRGRDIPQPAPRGERGDQPAARRIDIGFIMWMRSEEHTSELQSLLRISYAVFRLKNKTTT